jgi:phage tail sheath protein FI
MHAHYLRDYIVLATGLTSSIISPNLAAVFQEMIMSTFNTAPGVFVLEVPSGVRPISGVSTSNTVFIDFFARGPVDRAVRITSFTDFERRFGGLDRRSAASYAIQQYFVNGGGVAFVVRVAGENEATPADSANRALGGGLLIAANAPGAWGNGLQTAIEPVGGGRFNLYVREVQIINGETRVTSTETHRDLRLPDLVAGATVQAPSQLVVMSVADGAQAAASLDAEVLRSVRELVLGAARGIFTAARFTAFSNALGNPGVAATANQTLEEALTANQAAVTAAVATAGGTAADATRVVRTALQSGFAGAMNVVDSPLFADMANDGTDGVLPGSDDWNADVGVAAILGENAEPGQVRGMRLLERIAPQVFNIMCLPAAPGLDAEAMRRLYSEAEAFCRLQRAFLLVDPPPGLDRTETIVEWIGEAANAGLRDDHAAMHFPRVLAPDPLDRNRERPMAASGAIAGVFARIDATRGVWKAPAGTEADLRGCRPAAQVTEGESAVLNPLGINALRSFPVYGPVVWGARTLDGADAQASEYKYIPIRRVALYIEESLRQGLQWVVFEPNDEPLWAQIRLNAGAFMHGLFRQGAFQGSTPAQAYLVKCDSETTTQADIDRGIVNILIGFAPLKPAEFVFIRIQQLTQQAGT